MKPKLHKGDVKLILSLILLIGGLVGYYLYFSYLKSLPSQYTICTKYWTKLTGKGRRLFYVYIVDGKEYQSSDDAPYYDLCTDCKYVVEFKVPKKDYAFLETWYDIPDSIDLVPPPQGWDSIPVERRGGQTVVKAAYKQYIKK
jgi:hypothetical protein